VSIPIRIGVPAAVPAVFSLSRKPVFPDVVSVHFHDCALSAELIELAPAAAVIASSDRLLAAAVMFWQLNV
jgi:hypothetical protein